MPLSYAEADYYEKNFGSPPPAIAGRMYEELARASRTVRAEMKLCGTDIDAQIDRGDLDPDLVADVVCEMVKAAASSPGGQGVDSVQMSAGPYQETVKYTNPVGDLYMTKKQKRLLGCGGQRAWEYDPLTHLDPPA